MDTASLSSSEYCLFFTNYWWLCHTKSEWASWLQAIFSSVGIIVAVFVVRYQVAKNRLHELEKIASKMEARAGMIRQVAQTIKEAHDSFGNSTDLTVAINLVSRARVIIDEIAAIQLEKTDTYGELITLIEAKEYISRAIVEHDDASRVVYHRWFSLFEKANKISAYADDLFSQAALLRDGEGLRATYSKVQ